jgi:hypothetical protein
VNETNILASRASHYQPNYNINVARDQVRTQYFWRAVPIGILARGKQINSLVAWF